MKKFMNSVETMLHEPGWLRALPSRHCRARQRLMVCASQKQSGKVALFPAAAAV
jgi:hypothetical protein